MSAVRQGETMTPKEELRVSSPPGAALTVADVIDLSMAIMDDHPEPDADGVFDDAALAEWEEELKFVCSSIADKVHVLRAVADRLATEANFVRSQENVLVARRKTLASKRERVIDRMRELLIAAEQLEGKPKVKTGDSSWVSIRRVSNKVVQVAEGYVDKLPSFFVRVRKDPDKAALMKLYQDTGEDFLPEGVTVEESHSEAVMWPGKVK